MTRFLPPLVALVLIAIAIPTNAGVVQNERTENATRVLTEILRIPEESIPTRMLAIRLPRR